MGKLDGKKAFITGADSGIGRAIAIAFALEGAEVAVCYHSDRKGGEETVKLIQLAGGKAYAVKIDISSEKQVEKRLSEAVSLMGSLDILVNNAAVNGSGVPVAEMETAQFDASIRTNLYGVFFASRFSARYVLKEKRKGKILNISSIHEEIAMPGSADYDASKGAIRMFTRTLALELAATGTTVNNIGPGMILTPMNQEAVDDEKLRKEKAAHIPLRRPGNPDEVAKLALFLCSGDADYITGATYFIDGGLMLNTGQGA